MSDQEDMDFSTQEADLDFLAISPQLNVQKAKSQILDSFKQHNSKGMRQPINADTSNFIGEEREIYRDQCFMHQDDFEEEKEVQSKERKVDTLEEFMKKRKELIDRSNADRFSVDIELSKKEQKAEAKLMQIHKKMFDEDATIATGAYYDKLPKLLASDLYDCLNVMPKPVVHHIHLTAACPISYLVEKLLYYDFVYYNEKSKMFKVHKDGIKEEGYIKVNTLRQYWEDSQSFDKYLYDTIILHEGVETQEHHEIWKYFQPKFMMTMELYNYARFFKMILYRVAKNMIKQCITVIEWKHIFGMVFDENGPLSLKDEIAIFTDVSDYIKQQFPLFEMRIVCCGLKIVGKAHIQNQIDAYFEAKKYTNIVVGFDMVNEEDFTPEISEFLPQIYEARKKAADMGIEFPVYLHCGESNASDHTQLYDAILLETKRIGHGFHLAYHPELMEIVKQKEICIECCPVSNFVLGYILDLRTHPARSFLHAGLPVSISSDDPGFMGYEGVTLDYVYAFLAWNLDIADLKQLCINSIKYSSITEEHKQKLLIFFGYKWDRFLDYVIGKY